MRALGLIVAGAMGGIVLAVVASFAARAADPEYEMFLGFAVMAGMVVGAAAGLLAWLGSLVGEAVARSSRASAPLGATVVTSAIGAWLIASSGGAVYAIVFAAVAIAATPAIVLWMDFVKTS
ncbi:putative YccA/Bax inhibitor family protein [Microbacteriaceae bacterium SG_E_30_P1]|uniref:YccA/Bax inhibitor family protein n=1 Tax=Antiquaquibacter oligotrophicus TaxID=2880260 RepID=A0ABT6KK03_9MICO|nr:hypothetical protein [Antiquaquibacter oligotrophicus]MDH6180154.1 putative YccA/Bax inhibitor family protein [Antiquaquibacter oligotrophicus]UDF14094.1 hypothetical protein LH407_04350 [Antiquaquibacter oligotrophicus]